MHPHALVFFKILLSVVTERKSVHTLVIIFIVKECNEIEKENKGRTVRILIIFVVFTCLFAVIRNVLILFLIFNKLK